MYYLSEIIKESLKKLNSEEEREFLRYLKSGDIKEVEEDFLNNLLEIENETTKIIMENTLNYTIYTVPVNYKEYLEIDEMLFPLFKEDSDEYSGNYKKDIPKEGQEKGVFRRIYLDVEFHEIEKFKNKVFKAELEIQGRKYQFKVRARQIEKYQEKEKEILRVFKLNRITWKIQNTLYNRRFFELYIENLPEEINYKELKNINVDYENYGNAVYENAFLVWNIMEKDILMDKLKNDILEKHMNKAKIYSNESASDLMKINNGKIFKIERYETFIYIYTDEDPNNDWRLWNIRNIGSIERYDKLRYRLLGNDQESDLISKLKEGNGKRVRSEAEVFETVNSLNGIKNLKLAKIKLNGYVENSVEGYNANKTFDETVTFRRKKKDVLYLYFYVKNEKDKYLYDELSFVLSNIEYLYPEYKVKGVLKWK